MTKVIIDQEKCIGCGMCASMNPNIFEMDTETGKAKTDSSDCEGAKGAIEMCPVKAISCSE